MHGGLWELEFLSRTQSTLSLHHGAERFRMGFSVDVTLSPSHRSTLCHADRHEAGQQDSGVPQVPGQTHGPAGVGEWPQSRGRLPLSPPSAV